MWNNREEKMLTMQQALQCQTYLGILQDSIDPGKVHEASQQSVRKSRPSPGAKTIPG